MYSLRKLFQIASPPRKAIILATLCLTVETAASLAAPWIGGQFGEQILSRPNTDSYQELLLIWFLLLLTQQGLRIAGSYIAGSAGALATAQLRNRVYDHLQALPLTYHRDRSRGDTLTLLSRDAGIVGQFFTSTLPGLLPQVLLMTGAWAMMLLLSLKLALLIGLAVPLIVLGFRLLARQLRPLATQLAEAHADHLAAVEENLRLLNLLKAFNRDSIESERVAGHSYRIVGLEKRHLWLVSIIGPFVQASGAALLMLVLWIGAEQLTNGTLTAGAAISLLLYGLLLFRPASQLASMAGSLQSTLGAAQRMGEVLDSEPEPLHTGQTTLPGHAGAIRFENLEFAYPGHAELFGGLDFDVQPGEIIAVSGHNGSGKTTLINMLMRFLEPTAGRILVGGVDIRDIRLDTLRRAIGLVPQEVALLNASVRANIAYGLPDATEAEIQQAAEIAQASGFIDTLPHGMDTLVGPDGFRLSGGQRQRIALARAILKNCPILIFDEATSMIDATTELHLSTQFRTWLRGRTVLLITHRAETLALADRELSLAPL